MPRRKRSKAVIYTYASWIAARKRCFQKTRSTYRLYGGRGITMCERWNSFDAFLCDMGERPVGTTLDRINSDGNYEPGNCRWATNAEQQRNRRNVRLVTFKGETLPLHAMAERYGLTNGCIYRRVVKNGMPLELALMFKEQPGKRLVW